MITVKGIRTNCVTTLESIISVSMELRFHEGLGSEYWWAITEGGVTGFESYDSEHTDRMIEKGWMACMGTKGVWDKLFIPAKSMLKIQQCQKKQMTGVIK